MSLTRERIQFLYTFIRPYRMRLLMVALLSGVCTVFLLTPPLAMKFLLDRVVTPQRWSLLWFAVLLIGILPIWNKLLSTLQSLMIASVAQRFMAELRTEFFRHVLNLSMRYHGTVGSGALMNRIMGDAGVVQNLITYEILGVFTSLISLLFALTMTFLISWRVALILVLVSGLYTINHFVFTRRIRAAHVRIQEVSDIVTRRLHERICGVKLVKTYSREGHECAEFLSATDQVLEFGLRGQMLHATFSSVARLISGLGASAASVCLMWAVINQSISIGDMIAFEQYVWQITGPFLQLTLVSGSISQALVSLDRLMEVFRDTSAIRDPETPVEPEPVRGELRLENVAFDYTPDKPLFEDLNLVLPAGTMTALVGHTGCGKTTVTSLLLRLWDVRKGRITLDGIDIRNLSRRSLRRFISCVPQEAVIFEGTILENIAYGLPAANAMEAEEAARAANLHDWILEQPAGYQTWLGKQGIKLSAGLKQQIAIARAVCVNPAVLILDEATSALDSASEQLIQAALDGVLHNRTSVVVAHRLSTIVRADNIVVMDHGRIVESGTHTALMRQPGGVYRRLYEEMTQTPMAFEGAPAS